MNHTTPQSGKSAPGKAQHLCVLVHGLWGNSQHLWYIAQALRDQYNEEELVILNCKSNASSFTYDGIEIGGERVAKEIEDSIEQLGKEGHKITRLSVVGYSLGGLVSRYAIGLLDHKGCFDHIQPANFTTFATPHLGVRTPLLGYGNHLWNVLGARTLSASGRQLFAIDNFRQTGRPLLSILADPDSIFIHALSRFQRRTLYGNIVNDRSVVFYTSSISKTNPYVDIDQLDLNFIKGYDSVILDPDQPYHVKQAQSRPGFQQQIRELSSILFQKTPIYLALAFLIPIGVVAFLVNSSVQTFRSRKRIMLHESDSTKEGFGVYRIPYVVREVRAGLEDAFEVTNAAQEQDFLPDETEDTTNRHQIHRRSDLHGDDLARKAEPLPNEKVPGDVLALDSEHASITSTSTTRCENSPAFPTLALTEQQFEMIDALNAVGFRKYPVFIQRSGHSHAAIIVRTHKPAFDEGKVVMRHWLENEFHL